MAHPLRAAGCIAFAIGALCLLVAPGVALGAAGVTPAATPEKWFRLHPAVSPASRQLADMVYDPVDKYVVLFGGGNGSGPNFNPPAYNDTWTYRAGTWTQLALTLHPPWDAGSTMVFDRADGYVLYFDGNRCGGSCGNTWEFKGGKWTNITPSHSPPPRRTMWLAYDGRDGYVVMFGGFSEQTLSYLNDTWKFVGANWTQIPTTVAPTPRADGAMGGLSYDRISRYLVLFGGDNGFGGSGTLSDTWAFAGGAWTLLHPPVSPISRDYQTMGWDPLLHGLVMFGGVNNGVPVPSTWLFSSGAWTNITPTHSPRTAYDPSSTYDWQDGYFLLFGGGSCVCGTPHAYSSQTWVLS
ncbi:MAG: hypothetical protein L3K19_05370 [Thermoplasmata archaeon]|nr:hypothetical protein [Thermoplasmata archaeon]